MELQPMKRRTLFDAKGYLERYPDVAASGMDPYKHFVRYGAAENRAPCLMFDPVFYRMQIGKTVKDPTSHYLLHGARNGFDPHPQFSSTWYLERYPDVAKSGWNPLVHYQKHGVREGRNPAPEYQRVFGRVMPASHGLRLPHFSSMRFAGSVRDIPKARYVDCIAIPMKIAVERHTSVSTALSLVSAGRLPEVCVSSLQPIQPTTMLAVFHHCSILQTGNTHLDLSFQDAQWFRVVDGVPGFLASAGAGAASLSVV